MNWETYLALGDSITFGARTYQCYPEYTGKILEQALNKVWNVVNHSTSGYTATNLARDIDLHINTLKSQSPSITSVLIGTNDVKNGVSPEDYEIALNQVVIKAKLITVNANVVLFKIPLFTKGIMYPYNIKMNERIAHFNEIIEALAERHQLRTIAFDLDENDFFDGVHLNKDGAQKIAEEFGQFILKERGVTIG